jgi:hypothetical protein
VTATARRRCDDIEGKGERGVEGKGDSSGGLRRGGGMCVGDKSGEGTNKRTD